MVHRAVGAECFVELVFFRLVSGAVVIRGYLFVVNQHCHNHWLFLESHAHGRDIDDSIPAVGWLCCGVKFRHVAAEPRHAGLAVTFRNQVKIRPF